VAEGYAPHCAARCAEDDVPCDANAFCSGAPETNADEQTAELARFQAAAVELEASEDAARVVARVNEAGSVRLERVLSVEQAAELLSQLAPAFERQLPEAAALLRRIATDSQLTHAEGQPLTQLQLDNYRRAFAASENPALATDPRALEAFEAERSVRHERNRARRYAAHKRALDVLRLSTRVVDDKPAPHENGERAWLLSNHLREAALPLAWLRENPEHAAKARCKAKCQAAAFAHRDETLRKLPVRDLLVKLERFALPRQGQFGKGQCIQGGLSAIEEARLVREILGQDIALSDEALRKQMDRASRLRLARFNPQDTTCPERSEAGERIIDACPILPPRDSAKPSGTESSATASHESLPRSASRRPR